MGDHRLYSTDARARDGSANLEGLRLNRQVLPHFGLVEVLGRAGVDDLAAVHDVDLVGELAAEIEILLDQQDRRCRPVSRR